MCHKFKHFMEALSGISGRKPGEKEVQNCEKVCIKDKSMFTGRSILQKKIKDDMYNFNLSRGRVNQVEEESSIKGCCRSTNKQFKIFSKRRQCLLNQLLK